MDNRESRFADARITATGWRLVGTAASLLSEHEPLDVGADDDCVFAARFRIRPWLGRERPLGKTLNVLGNAIAREWPDMPPLTADQSFARPASRFQGVHWATDGERGAWIGELHWRYSHPVVRGVACQLHAVLHEQEDVLTLTVRVFIPGGIQAVRGLAGVGQARPPFISALNRDLRLTHDWGETAPVVVSADTMSALVRDTLLSESRDFPVAVVSPLDDGTYVLPPDEIADELLGLCRLYVIDRHPTTFSLTDLLGDKRLSCFWGALRVYMPDFTCASSPEEHPLLLRDWLEDPVLRAELVGRLSVTMKARVPVPHTISARRERAGRSVKRESPKDPSRRATTEPGAAAATADREVFDAQSELQTLPVTTHHDVRLAAPLGALTDEIRTLTSAIQQLAAANRELQGEVARLRTAAAVRAVGANSVERRLDRIDNRLGELLAATDRLPERAPVNDVIASPLLSALSETASDDDDAPSLLQVVRLAASAHADALLFLESAERSAVDSPFEDVDRVAALLDAMAEVARRRQRGGLGMSVRDAFREYGIDYRGAVAPSTSERQRSQYQLVGADGSTYECLEHLVVGSTYDPRYCLRIYFTSRAPLESRFVIGHVGRHFDVKSTT